MLSGQEADTLVERVVVKVLLGAPEAATRLLLEAEQAAEASRNSRYFLTLPDCTLLLLSHAAVSQSVTHMLYHVRRKIQQGMLHILTSKCHHDMPLSSNMRVRSCNCLHILPRT